MTSKKWLLALALGCLLGMAHAYADDPNDTANQSQLVEQGSYNNVDGQTVHKPAHSKSGKRPDGATAKCGDGTYSFSQHHRGTCSRHGGVAEWFK
ncbi:DUF3761 domain-containing protein [Paludibacterium purpuratum]|uniref:Uncharacterized protein DUF3761 n=1 Tax=Paludibacterium purpuratum TaxID=1144873 RepID=A0A4R7AWT8_9NEIS|nr:DUF3761 domain-containing protein [Paludibacterium purpuratum]TDR72018.1 uncharacterized protein DUF3761 [Paludibacterium purpuratum]